MFTTTSPADSGDRQSWAAGRFAVLGLMLVVVVAMLAGMVVFVGRPRFFDYVPIGIVPDRPEPPGPRAGAATGSFTSECGRNENWHHNSDNLITLPGQPGGALHSHEYVGNLVTDADATNQDLAKGGTTCTDGDRSAYFWVVLRSRPGAPSDHHTDPGWAGLPHNQGVRIPANTVTIEYRGNPAGPVVAMPRLLRMVVGNAHALTAPSPAASTAHWGCDGSAHQWTQLYPLCPPGQTVLRRYDFPSCWDGRHLDSPTHRSHVTYPAADGTCPHNTFPIPQLRIDVSYTVPPGRTYAIDTFPEEHRSPLTDHAEYINVMPDTLMIRAVHCINTGRHC